MSISQFAFYNFPQGHQQMFWPQWLQRPKEHRTDINSTQLLMQSQLLDFIIIIIIIIIDKYLYRANSSVVILYTKIIYNIYTVVLETL